MNNPYEIISNLHSYYDNQAATVIEGKNFGEKAIFSNGEMIYESKEGAFSAEAKIKIMSNRTEGLLSLDDCTIYSEALGNEKRMVICGGGHVSIPVIQIAKMTGFHVTVIEDRIQFADNIRRTEADEVLCDDFSNALNKISGDPDTYFVIVTRGHRYDQVCLEAILKKDNAYIGMIGSKVRVKQVKDVMKEKGFCNELLENVHSPIGLKIGAETPEEIAVSIMAEIIEVKNQAKRGSGYPKEILKAIFNDETKAMPKMLATIISRKGSAPRNVGTKMLIFKDGTTIGTIGGGCVEADICSKARYQLMEADNQPKVYTVDMTGRDAEEEGMVCGGIVKILLEKV
jgi:xanthine dehydrogenase accessory factor